MTVNIVFIHEPNKSSFVKLFNFTNFLIFIFRNSALRVGMYTYNNIFGHRNSSYNYTVDGHYATTQDSFVR
jgi:hypothetical protein